MKDLCHLQSSAGATAAHIDFQPRSEEGDQFSGYGHECEGGEDDKDDASVFQGLGQIRGGLVELSVIGERGTGYRDGIVISARSRNVLRKVAVVP